MLFCGNIFFSIPFLVSLGLYNGSTNFSLLLVFVKRTSMLKAYIFPKSISITKWGEIFKSMNCAFFSCICSNTYVNHVVVQISSNGEIIKNISTYPKINICSHHVCSRLHKSSDSLSFCPILP